MPLCLWAFEHYNFISNTCFSHFLLLRHTHTRASQVLQYFSNLRHNLIVPDAFAEVMKVTNNTGLRDAVLAWYSLRATHQIYFYSLEHSQGINGFKHIWFCLVIEVHLSYNKFFVACAALLPSSNLLSINSWIRLHCTFICVAFKLYREWSKWKMCQHIKYHITTNHRRYLKLLQSSDICATN